MNHGSGDPIDGGDLIFYPDEAEVSYKGHRIRLKAYPLKVLACIHGLHPTPASNEYLRMNVWGSKQIDTNLPQQNVSKASKILRRFGLYIHSTKKVGYHIARVEEEVHTKRFSQNVFEQPMAGGHGSLQESVQESKIVAYTSWKPCTIAFSQAANSITIVDSFYSEYWDLGPCIMAKTEELKVSVYMVSPDTDFGAQRLKEMDRAGKDDRACAAILWKSISATERKRYRHDFDECVSGLAMIAKDTPVQLRIYEYSAMPSTRIIAVDDRHFFFGWFPLWAYNPGYICLHLEDNGLSGADREVIRRLREQIKNIALISRLRLSSPPDISKPKKG